MGINANFNVSVKEIIDMVKDKNYLYSGMMKKSKIKMFSLYEDSWCWAILKDNLSYMVPVQALAVIFSKILHNGIISLFPETYENTLNRCILVLFLLIVFVAAWWRINARIERNWLGPDVRAVLGRKVNKVFIANTCWLFLSIVAKLFVVFTDYDLAPFNI